MNSIDDLRNWMIMEKLMINDDKTKTKFFYVVLLMVNMTLIQPCVLDLGEWFACLINTKFCNAAFYYFHNKYWMHSGVPYLKSNQSMHL